ncbi:terminase small subunit [bacterium]|nr:MAG: terminase small subunit [bacterium]
MAIQPKEDQSKENQPLNPQQEQFCHEYLKDKNATRAYIRAGYSTEGARQNAGRLMTNDYVCAKINELITEQFNNLKVTATRVLKSLLEIAETDPADAFTEDGSLKPMKEIPKPLRKAIASIDIEELFDGRGKDREQIGYVKKIRFWNKNEALRDLGRHKRLFVDIVDNPALSNLARELKAARERREKCRSK